jgi:hypothetical protein
MTDPSMAPAAPDVAETVGFLRRFADLMSNGYNAAYLHRASDLLETMAARVIGASDEEDLWRYKYETLGRHTDALEAECDALKHDIEGHLEITSSVLAERDALGAALQELEAELSELRGVVSRERDERAATSAAQEDVLAGLHAAFDRKREALEAELQAGGAECDQLRRDLAQERDDGAAKLAASEAALSELRLAFDRERGELQAQLKVRSDELTAFRIVSEREHGALRQKVASLEAKRVELRAAIDRINDLRHQTIEPQEGSVGIIAGKSGVDAEADQFAALPGDLIAGEANTLVPKTTLRQARAQFEYLAREFVPLGDIASQVMCELGAYTMDLALIGGQPIERLPVGEVAQSILARGAER